MQQHVGTRTSTQARSHAQKFFVKLDKKNLTMEQYLEGIDFQNIEKDLLFSDLEDDSNQGEKYSSNRKKSSVSLNCNPRS